MLRHQVESKGAVGPLFVSIGDAPKLLKFLELNPLVPRNQTFVDSYEFTAYKTAGLRSMENGYKPPDGAMAKLTAPNLGGISGWWNYLKNSMKLSPIQEGKEAEFPVGVLLLGGTFVIEGDEILFAYEDPLPGVEANLTEAMAVL